MNILFVKDQLAWPRASGHDVHSYHMIAALAKIGHRVSLATTDTPTPEAVAGLPLEHLVTLDGRRGDHSPRVRLSKLQDRFRSYWGIERDRIEAVRDASDATGAEAVVAVGLGVLPYLAALDGPIRVWYAGDEWAWHHTSQVRAGDPSSWSNFRDAAIKGCYEWAYAGMIDRTWVVSAADRRAMRLILHSSKVDVVPNGVDGDHFRTPSLDQHDRTCVFWGRLDFGPNVQALEWFCRRVWPLVRHRVPAARFTIYGFRPTARVMALTSQGGVDVVPDLPDLRGEVARHQVVVLPFVSGGGIKNKLLEAASMGLAIVGTPQASNGLDLGDREPLLTARTARQWVRAIDALWDNPERRRSLGAEARRWVLERHTWEAAARIAGDGLVRMTQA